MGRTRTQLRQLVAKEFPLPFRSGTADAGGSTTTLVDAGVLGQFGDNDLIGAWIYLTSGSPSHTALRVIDNDQSSTNVTFRPTLGAAPDTLDYEILPFEPEAIHQSIEEAIKDGYDRRWLVRDTILQHWATDSPLYNANFDYWTSSSQPDGWTTSGTVSRITRYSDEVIPGEFSCKIEDQNGYIETAINYRYFLSDLEGHKIRVRMWARRQTAALSSITVAVRDGGGSSVASDTIDLAATNRWRLVETDDLTITEGTSDMHLRITNTESSNTLEIGAVWIIGGPRTRVYPFPITLAPDGPDAIYAIPISSDLTNLHATYLNNQRFLVNNWQVVRSRQEATSNETGFLILEQPLPPEYRLYMPTTAPLTAPSVDGDIVEVSTPEDILLAKIAARKLAMKASFNVSDSTRRRLLEHAAMLETEINDLAKGRGSRGRKTIPLTADF